MILSFLKISEFKKWSLKSRLVLTVIILVFSGLLVSSFASYKFIDNFLSIRGEQEVTSLLNGPFSPSNLSDSAASGNLIEPNPGVYVAIFDSEANLVTSTGGYVNGQVVPPLLKHVDAEFVNDNSGRIFETFSLDKTYSFRTAAKAWSNGSGYIVVAVNKSFSENELQKVLKLSLSVAFAILLLLIITARYAINFALKPLLSFVDVASSISEGRRESRWEVETSSGEVEILGKSFNQMLETVNISIDQKEEYANSLKRFIADASHELKTPLTVIQGFSEMLRKGMIVDSGEIISAYARVEKESRRMARLVEDLLTLARIDQGSSLVFEPFDIDGLIEEVLANSKISASTHDFHFNSNSKGLQVIGDPGSILRLLSNLVSNAYKYSSPESKILIETKISKGFITIDVSDEGVGIPASERKLVFDRFYKASSNTHPEKNTERGIESSTGLGLAIAYSIAEKHGGVLECIAPKLKGATFRFNLPLAN